MGRPGREPRGLLASEQSDPGRQRRAPAGCQAAGEAEQAARAEAEEQPAVQRAPAEPRNGERGRDEQRAGRGRYTRKVRAWRLNLLTSSSAACKGVPARHSTTGTPRRR